MVLAHGGGRGQHPGLPSHGLRAWERPPGSAACKVRLTPSRPLELAAAVWFWPALGGTPSLWEEEDVWVKPSSMAVAVAWARCEDRWPCRGGRQPPLLGVLSSGAGPSAWVCYWCDASGVLPLVSCAAPGTESSVPASRRASAP